MCGIGVISEILFILRPPELSARTADSLPGPGPCTNTSTLCMPDSIATEQAFSAATWATKGVLFLDPRKPEPPEVAQLNVFPCLSVIVTIVLLKDACTWANPSTTTLIAFLRYAINFKTSYFLTSRVGPLRVRALVFVLWPFTGS